MNSDEVTKLIKKGLRALLLLLAILLLFKKNIFVLMGFTTIFTIDLEISILNKRAKFLKILRVKRKENAYYNQAKKGLDGLGR